MIATRDHAAARPTALLRGTLAAWLACLVAFAVAAPLPPTYYNTVGALQGEALKEELRQIVSGNRGFPVTVISYNAARDALLQSVDNVGSNQVRTVYLNDLFPTSAWATQINREHTWPQSYGAGSSPMVSDMHHLYLCENGINSSRGNALYGNVVIAGATAYMSSDLDPNDTNYLRNGVWQVSNNKRGDVARAILYMETRYLNFTLINEGQTLGSNQMGYLNVMLQWHDLDPVDALEVQRNDRVFDYQNNRNPYVDHPEYVGRVYGGGMGAGDPVMTNLVRVPSVPNIGNTVSVSVDVTDPDGLASVTLHWRLGSSGAYSTIAMPLSAGTTYTATTPIPAQPEGTLVQYYAEAIDTLANSAVLPPGGASGPESYIVAGDKPVLSNLNILPTTPDALAIVTIRADVTDDDGNGAGNLTVQAFWREQGAGGFATIPMAIVTGTTWGTTTTIPAHPAGTIIEYYVRATDLGAATDTIPAGGAASPASYLVEEVEPYLPITSVGQVVGTLLITEFAHEVGTDALTEFVEIVNNSAQGYIIDNLMLTDNADSGDTGESFCVFPPGSTLPAGGIAVVFVRSAPPQAFVNTIPTTSNQTGAPVKVYILEGTGATLTHDGTLVPEMIPEPPNIEMQLAAGGDNIALVLSTTQVFTPAQVIDGVGYGAPSGPDATCWGPTVRTTAAGDNITLAGGADGAFRTSAIDTDTKADWAPSPNDGTTPGVVPFTYVPVELSAFGLE